MIRQRRGKNTRLEGLLKIATNQARIHGSQDVPGNG